MSTKEVAVVSPRFMAIAPEMKPETIDLILRTLVKGGTPEEQEMFLMQCVKTGLDPLTHQIHAVKRWDSTQNREVMAIQIGIDGYRLIAQRTGEYQGQTTPEWCGDDGVWKETWLASVPPAAARIGVYRKGFRDAVYGVARYKSYVQTKKDGNPTGMWSKMPDNQLLKCAEALALRKAFPQELSSVYADDEITNFEEADVIDTKPSSQSRLMANASNAASVLRGATQEPTTPDPPESAPQAAATPTKAPERAKMIGGMITSLGITKTQKETGSKILCAVAEAEPFGEKEIAAADGEQFAMVMHRLTCLNEIKTMLAEMYSDADEWALAIKGLTGDECDSVLKLALHPDNIEHVYNSVKDLYEKRGD